MKRVMVALIAVLAVMGAWAATWTDPDTGYTWTYYVNGDTAQLYSGYYPAAVSPEPTGVLVIPSALGGYSLTHIGSEAFSGCNGLTSVIIPNSVTSIGSEAFSGCSGLTSVPIGNSVTNVGDRAFTNCRSLTSIVIPDSVISIGERAFANCDSVTSLTIGNSVTSIGYEAFYGCSGLTSVTIGNSGTSIGSGAFSGCDRLMSINVAAENAHYKSVDGLLLSKDARTLVLGVNGDVTIPDGVTTIGDSAFRGCRCLTSITIPDSVTSIGSYAFYDCSGPMSVTIPDSVVRIEDDAFCSCDSMTTVKIGKNLAYLGRDAFSFCEALTSVYFTGDAPYAEDTVFRSSSKSMVVYVTPGTTGWVLNSSGELPIRWPGYYFSENADARLIRFAPDGTSEAASGGASGGGSPSVVTTVVQQVVTEVITTIVQQVESPYALANHVADRAIASVTVDSDCAIDAFVLKDGVVYDLMLRIVNAADHEVKLTLPAGYSYETFKGVKPLAIPAKSRSMLSITRVADKTFLVSREELEDVK